jgi:hypothetical protein
MLISRREVLKGLSVVSAALPLGIPLGETQPKKHELVVPFKDPQGLFIPGQMWPSRGRVPLEVIQARVLLRLEQEDLKLSDFNMVHVQLLRDGQDWTKGVSDPYFPVAHLQQRRWDIIYRGVDLAYNQVRAPYRAAFMDKIKRGESRFSKMEINALFTTTLLTEDEAQECGLLIPPHDEIRLVFRA